MTIRPKRGAKSRRVLTLAEHLRTAATDSDLTVYRIAKETGVDQSTLNKFLTGARDNLRLDVADRLYRFFFNPPRPRKRRDGGMRRSGRERRGP